MSEVNNSDNVIWVLPKRAQQLLDRMEEALPHKVKVVPRPDNAFSIVDRYGTFCYDFDAKGKPNNYFGKYSLPSHHPEDYFIYGLPKCLEKLVTPGVRGLRDVTDRYTYSLEMWNKFAKEIGYSSCYEFFWILDLAGFDWEFQQSRSVICIFPPAIQVGHKTDFANRLAKALGFKSFDAMSNILKTAECANVSTNTKY